MTGSLVVHLNREGLHEMEVPSGVYETDGTFEVQFHNHGRAVHVHLKLGGALSRAATVSDPNRFVDTDASDSVRVQVDPDAVPLEGQVEVVVGYGGATETIPVEVGDVTREPVDVDRSLGRPAGSDAGNDLLATVAEQGALQVVAMAAGALFLALLSIALAPSVVVGLGVVAVLAGIGVAAFLLVG